MQYLFDNNSSHVKNARKEEYELPRNLDQLNKWTIPKVNPRLIYNFGRFDFWKTKQVVKTTEESISLDNEEKVIKLLDSMDIRHYQEEYKFLHIGLVQIAFKPLTLEGLPKSFLAALRDARNLDWKKSLIGIIQSSLAHGPVFFNVYPNLQLSMSDVNILDALTLNVKTHGYNYTPGSELICICYRIYYKLLHTLNPNCKTQDNKTLEQTVFFETNLQNSRINTRRQIKWSEVEFPEHWVIEKEVPIRSNTESMYTNILQNPKGNVIIDFVNQSKYLRSCSSRYSNMSYISPIEVTTPSRASTSQIREETNSSNYDKVEEIRVQPNNIVKGVYKDPKLNEELTSETNFCL